MAKKPPPPDEPPDESWMATFADAITLLMAFFVMLLTFAEYDIPAFDEAAAAIAERVGGDPQINPSQQLKMELEDTMYEMQADQAVQVQKDSRGVTIEIKGGAFFKPGTAQIRKVARPVLKGIADKIGAPKFRCFNVEVIGHTDDIPIRNKIFRSNWELSAGRASRIVRLFISDGLESYRMKASGYGDSKPKVPNRDQEGKAIRENQATNRRIEVKLERMSLEEQKKCDEKGSMKDMLSKIKDQGSNIQPIK